MLLVVIWGAVMRKYRMWCEKLNLQGSTLGIKMIVVVVYSWVDCPKCSPLYIISV